MAKRKHTTKTEDAAFIARMYESLNKKWAVGDECMTYDGTKKTTVVKIEDKIVTVADEGTYRTEREFHISRLRMPQ